MTTTAKKASKPAYVDLRKLAHDLSLVQAELLHQLAIDQVPMVQVSTRVFRSKAEDIDAWLADRSAKARKIALDLHPSRRAARRKQ